LAPAENDPYVLTNKRAKGTSRHFAIADRVLSEGEIFPVSSFESIPGEIIAVAASSAKVIPFARRRQRTSRPILASTDGWSAIRMAERNDLLAALISPQRCDRISRVHSASTKRS
jgi:hypothetical protein